MFFNKIKANTALKAVKAGSGSNINAAASTVTS